MDPAWIALIGTVVGGAGLKVIESFLARGTNKVDLATKLREELRAESKTLKEELRLAEKELDQWKEKYFLLFQDYVEIRGHADPKPEPKPKPEW